MSITKGLPARRAADDTDRGGWTVTVKYPGEAEEIVFSHAFRYSTTHENAARAYAHEVAEEWVERKVGRVRLLDQDGDLVEEWPNEPEPFTQHDLQIILPLALGAQLDNLRERLADHDGYLRHNTVEAARAVLACYRRLNPEGAASYTRAHGPVRGW